MRIDRPWCCRSCVTFKGWRARNATSDPRSRLVLNGSHIVRRVTVEDGFTVNMMAAARTDRNSSGYWRIGVVREVVSNHCWWPQDTVTDKILILLRLISEPSPSAQSLAKAI